MEGYKNLSCYILATVICDLNVQFIKRWINPKSRTCDQMEQAGRSGKQNIAEGYTMQSLEGYIKLAGVAEGSNKELGADYEDFLRQNNLSTWDKDDPRIRVFRGFRAVWKSPNNPNTPNLPNNTEEAANMLLTFCQMETYLINRLILSLKDKFVKEGGFRENLFKKRVAFKKTFYSFLLFLSLFFLFPPPAQAANSGIFTVSLWVKPTSSIASQALVGKSEELRVFTDASGNAGCQIKSTTWQTASTGTTALTLNVWNHVACAYDKAKLTVYVNGTQTSQTTLTATIDDTANAILIGQDSSASTPYSNLTGTTDDFKFYNYARTQKQIIEDMGGGHPGVYAGSSGGSTTGGARGGPVAYYKFDEGYGTTANNVGYGGSSLNGTLSGMASPATSTSGWTQAGKFNKGLVFDGSDDVATVTNADAIDFDVGLVNHTFSAWVYATSAGENSVGQILQKGTNTYLRVDTLSGSNLDVEANLDLATTDANVNVSAPITTNSWNHILTTWDGTTLKVYINGVQRGSGTGSGAISADTNNLLIGGTTTANFAGTIDEVKIYPYALTADEVKLEYNKGSATVLGALGDNSSYDKQAANQEYCIPGDTSTCTAPVGRWDFEEKKGQTAQDSSGNANTGTLGTSSSADAADPAWAVGKKGAGLSFDGVDDYVSMADSTNLQVESGSFTVSVWVKPTIVQQQVILFKANPNMGASGYSLIMNRFGNDITLTKNGVVDQTVSYTFQANTWYYIVAVQPLAGNVTYYINGRSIGSYSNTSAYQSSSGRAFYIGDGDTYFANKFNGTIDETRIYNYARSAAQIAWDYNRGAPIAYWKFDEGQGGTLYDSSGNSNNGTWNGAAGGTQTAAGDINTSGTAWFNGKTGKRNYSLNFDGGDDYVSIATSALGSIGPTSSLSLSAWVKAASLPSTLKRVISNQTILNDFEITMSISPGNKWGATIGKAGVAAQDTLDSTVLTADNWYYLVAVYNGNSVTLYVNGQSKATTSANSTTNGASSTNRGWTIANERYGTSSPDTSYYFFPGQIDDVRIYNYALTPLQVRLLYNNGAVNFSPSTGAP